MQTTATNPLFDKDYSLWLKHPVSYSSLALSSTSIEPQLDQIFTLIFSLCYQTRYSLILELFFDDLTNINQITIDNLLRNLYNFATPLFPENPHFEFIILTPQLTNNPSILSRPPASTISVIFEHNLSSSHHKNLQLACPVQSLTLISHKFNANDFYTKLAPETASKELKAYKRSCLGGTYDHFHAGHRLFLSFSALATKEYLLVGLTSDELLLKKTNKIAIQSYETRRNSVRKFFDYFDPNIYVDIVEIKDPAGPAKDGDFDVIIVTPETIKGGDYVNKLRREGGYKELEVVVGNLVSSTGEIHDKLSSTNLREVIMEKVGGKVEVLEGLYKEWEGLMKDLGVEDEKFIGLWFDRIKEKYCESWRFYHTSTHVWELLRLTNENIEKIEEKDVVKLTAWFHDVIYVPQRGDNETESVRFFGEFYEDLEGRFKGKNLLTKEKKEKVEKIILFTINHTQIDKEAEGWFDAKFFLDIDLGILGADREIYREYTKNIRKEYCFVSEDVFREKRSQFMKKFLNKELRIYKTELFIEKLEAKALGNVEDEVQELDGIHESDIGFDTNVRKNDDL